MPPQPAGPLGPLLPGRPTDGNGLADLDAGPDDATSRGEREMMVKHQIESRGVRDARVLSAMRRVPRHAFVPAALRVEAYADHPLPIGHGQTISQPFIVALMTELARPAPTDRALEIGLGSGYQAAVLSRLVSRVFSLEIDDTLCREAAQRLSRLGYANISVAQSDGYDGLPDEAPFDVVVVTAAPDLVPQPLIDQLAPGGRLIIPVGHDFAQDLLVIEKHADGYTTTRSVTPVLFVPMIRRGGIG